MCALVTGVQTCALPIWLGGFDLRRAQLGAAARTGYQIHTPDRGTDSLSGRSRFDKPGTRGYDTCQGSDRGLMNDIGGAFPGPAATRACWRGRPRRDRHLAVPPERPATPLFS